MRSPARHLDRYRLVLLVGLSAVLAACGGGYQAPITEQGERQVVRAPLIVDSSTPDSSLRVENSRPVTVSSSGRGNAPVEVISSRPSQSSAQARPTSARPTTPSNTPRSHRVRAGDTLFSIAYQYDLDFRSLAIANGMSPPYTIFVDQQINLDLNAVPSNGSESAVASLGRAVGNNSVAQARAGTPVSSGVLRQPVSREPLAVSWQWPHQGRLVRGFQSGVSKGLDIAGSIGDPVFAAGDGDVVYSGRGIQGSGDLIIIRHSDRYLSAYAHNSRMLVSEGSRVRSGEKIAEVGQNSSGAAMLHFEIREAGDSVDPMRLLPRR